jgi:hypothetical protein
VAAYNRLALEQGQSTGSLSFYDFYYFTALVFAAIGTGTVRPDFRVALGAVSKLWNAQ